MYQHQVPSAKTKKLRNDSIFHASAVVVEDPNLCSNLKAFQPLPNGFVPYTCTYMRARIQVLFSLMMPDKGTYTSVKGKNKLQETSRSIYTDNDQVIICQSKGGDAFYLRGTFCKETSVKSSLIEAIHSELSPGESPQLLQCFAPASAPNLFAVYAFATSSELFSTSCFHCH
jgi:hypothetical protein